MRLRRTSKMENNTIAGQRVKAHQSPNILLSSSHPHRSNLNSYLKKQKTKKTRKVIPNSKSNDVSDKKDLLSQQKTTDDHVNSIPKSKKRRKNLAVNFSKTVDQSSEFVSKSAKKVSFNKTIESRLMKKKLEFGAKNESNQSPIKSILKHTCEPELEKVGNAKQSKAFVYLETWKKSRTIWKFEKVIQTWLLKNMFNEAMIPDEKFAVLLEYMKEMRGGAVLLAKKLCNNIIIKHLEESTPILSKCHRAQLVLQCLTK